MLLNDQRNGLQCCSVARALHAFARLRFVKSAMALAKKIGFVPREELVVIHVETDREMATAIFVGHPSILQAGQKTLSRDTHLGVIEHHGFPNLKIFFIDENTKSHEGDAG